MKMIHNDFWTETFEPDLTLTLQESTLQICRESACLINALPNLRLYFIAWRTDAIFFAFFRTTKASVGGRGVLDGNSSSAAD